MNKATLFVVKITSISKAALLKADLFINNVFPSLETVKGDKENGF